MPKQPKLHRLSGQQILNDACVMFKFKELLQNRDRLAALLSSEHGKALLARYIQRGLEVIEFGSGIPYAQKVKIPKAQAQE